MAENDIDKLNNKSTGKGGPRPGAGRPVGSLGKETKEKKKAEQEMIQRIVNNLEGIINAQLNLAHGAAYLYRIDETGEGKNKKREHVLVTDPEEIKRYLDSELPDGEELDNYYYITTKSPDGKAIDSLIDRVFGKASPKVGSDPENPIIIKIINYGKPEGDNNSLPLPSEKLPDAGIENGQEVQNNGVAQEIGKDKDSVERTDTKDTAEKGDLLLHTPDLPASQASDLGRPDKATSTGGDSIQEKR